MIMIASLLYVPCLGLAKVSLLLCYHQFALGKVFKFMVYAVMVVVVGYSFAIIIALIFPCVPIAKNWDITITKGTCLNRAAIYIATAAVNIATDVTLLLLPIPIVVTLQMRRMRKVSVVFVFALGSMCVFCSFGIEKAAGADCWQDLYHEYHSSRRHPSYAGESRSDLGCQCSLYLDVSISRFSPLSV